MSTNISTFFLLGIFYHIIEGDFMKKFKPVVFAIIIGCICALVLFKQVESDTLVQVEGNAVAIQIGVFTKEEKSKINHLSLNLRKLEK